MNTEKSTTPEDRFRDLKRDEMGPLMIVWSANATRKRLQIIRSKIKKATKGLWNGVLLHLLPGESVGSMKLPQAQALYETLMSAWDPDLYQIRMDRKAKAEAEAQEMTANQIADRLAEVKASADAETKATILDATARLEAAKLEAL